MKRFVLFALLVGAVACGDPSGNPVDPLDAPAVDAVDAVDAPTIDASDLDAPAIDAAVDATVDAVDAQDIDAPPPPPPFTGTISLLEVARLAPAPAPAFTVAAQGIQLGITFRETASAVPFALDTSPGTPFGCKVTELDTPEELASEVGIDEGAVQFTVDNGTGGGASPPITFPPCSFRDQIVGYRCPDPSSSQAITATDNVTLGPAGAPPSTLTLLTVVAGPATFDASDVGRYVRFEGTGVNILDAEMTTLPIVALGPSANQAILGTPVVFTANLTVGSLTTLAGAGPFPMLPPPGQLSNSASATATISPGGGNHFPATTVTNSDVGDDLSMDATNAERVRNIPRDGSEFTIACQMCGTATRTILDITTTDRSLAGITSPFAMPRPSTKRVNIRCTEDGQTSITVPANVSSYITSSGATRIQTTFIRSTIGTPAPASAGLTVISGHAIAGFTTVP